MRFELKSCQRTRNPYQLATNMTKSERSLANVLFSGGASEQRTEQKLTWIFKSFHKSYACGVPRPSGLAPDKVILRFPNSHFCEDF